VDGAELLGRTAFPSPATAIVPEARGSPAAVVVATSPGGRLQARTRALGPDADPPATRPDLAAVLSSAPAAAADPGAGPEAIAIWRVPAGGVGAFGEASVAMPVDAIGLPAAPADRWVVTIVALNDWGELARPVRAVVGRGTAGPRHVVDSSFVSPPWPFEASIRGEAEPGSRVALDGIGRATVVGPDGRFELPTVLAPWPQSVVVSATGPGGDATVRELSAIGGVDYRQLPWQGLVVVLVLVLPVVHALLGGRSTVRRRDPSGAAIAAPAAGAVLEVAPGVEIVELDPGELRENGEPRRVRL
jgi:hypothetical protein